MGIRLAIVGASGLVGRTFIKVIEEYQIEVDYLRVFSSSKNAGKTILFNNKEYILEELDERSFDSLDFALFSAGGEVSKKWAPIAEKAGCIVIDNSSAWRMVEDVSLIVPEINLNDYKKHRKIIANPNCSTIQSVIPLNALKGFGLKRIIYNTYQAVSGSGKKGLDDYHRTLNGDSPSFYPYNISKTCIPHIDVFLDNGFTKEEVKMINETRKILHMPNLNVTATCVRVPVEYSHGVSIVVELDKDFTVPEIIEAFKKQDGLVLLDDTKNSVYPTSIASTGNDLIYVGRIRKDICNPKTLLFYCTGDNVRKGAASNAIQIMRDIVKEKNL